MCMGFVSRVVLVDAMSGRRTMTVCLIWVHDTFCAHAEANIVTGGASQLQPAQW